MHFLQMYTIEHQANGLVKHIIQMQKTMMRQWLAVLDMPLMVWDKVSGECTFAYNTAMQEAMRETPFF